MASNPINVTDIKRLLAEMTPRPWLPGEHDNHIGGDPDHEDGPVHIVTMEEECMLADRAGIIALVNAAPVLVEIVDALVVYRTADRVLRDSMVVGDPDDPEYLDKFEAAVTARERLNSALPKVTR